jgi:hypothetical protein
MDDETQNDQSEDGKSSNIFGFATAGFDDLAPKQIHNYFSLTHSNLVTYCFEFTNNRSQHISVVAKHQ